MSLLSLNLRTFLVVQEHLTIGAAAKVLRLTQAAVTLRIQALERELDVTLFERSRRGMRLTPSGEALVRYCQRALELEAEVLPNLKPGESNVGTVHLVIQGPSSVLRNRFFPNLSGYLEKFPFVTLENRIMDLESGIERLKSGSVDLLVAERGQISKEFDSKILKSERYILVGPFAWRHRDLMDIIKKERIIDFDASDQMTLNYLRKYKLFEKAQPQRHFVNLTESIADLVTQKVGYSVLSVETAAPLMEAKKIYSMSSAQFLDYDLGVAWHPRKQMPKYFKELIQMLK